MPWAEDVTDHGATGDGATDDTAALQSGLDAAEGGWCVMPPGVYMTNRLWVRERTIVVVQPGATLRFLPQLSTDWGGVLNIVGTAQAPIEGVTIGGGGTIDGSAGSHQSSHLNLEGVDIEHAVGCTVRDITVVDAESDGVDLDESTDCTVDGVTLRGCGGWGVHISHGNQRTRVVSSLADSCGHVHERGGFDTHAHSGMNTTVDCSYMGCVAVGCYRGFWAKANRTTIVGCRSEGGTVNDLRVSNGAGTSVTGFRSKNSDAHGITIAGDTERTHLADITVRTATLAGIRVLSGAETVSVTGAHIVGCGGHGIHTSGTGGLYASSLVRGNTAAPQIRDTGSGNTVTGNAT